MQQIHQDHVPPDDAQPLPARAQLLADPWSPARISSLALQKGILDGSAAEAGMVGEKWTLLPLSRTHSTSGLHSLLQSSSSEWPEGAHLSGWHLLLLCHRRSSRSVTQLRGGGGGKRQGRKSGAEEGGEVGSNTREGTLKENGKEDLHNMGLSGSPAGCLKEKGSLWPPCLTSGAGISSCGLWWCMG